MPVSVVRVLIAYEDGFSFLRGYDRSKRSDPEPGDFMVINSLGIDGAFGKDIRDFTHMSLPVMPLFAPLSIREP